MNRGRYLPLAAGLALLSLFALAALAPGLFTGYGQKEMFQAWLAPSREHWLGTNSLGYDIFTELVYGTRETLLIGVSSSVLTMLLGAAAGVLSTVRGVWGWLSNALINVFALLPRLVTLIVLAGFLGSSGAEPDSVDIRLQLGGHGARRAREGDTPQLDALH